MKLLFSIIIIALAVSMILPVYSQTGTGETIQPIKEQRGIIKILESFQGTAPSGSLSVSTWLQWKLIYQDGTESGTTIAKSSAFSQFRAFTLSFVPQEQQYRTLIGAEVQSITDFRGLGSDLCYIKPSQKFDQVITVNGKSFNIPKQHFGSNEIKNGVLTGLGIKFTPELIERLLGFQGVTLKTGDVVVWDVTYSNTFGIWTGEVVDGTCGILGTSTGQVAYKGGSSGHKFSQIFVFADPLEQITIPTTSLPDLDGDGIPDVDDLCDFSPERFNGFQDEDGCPDADPLGFDPASITDQDGDGILDIDDACPFTAENFNGIDDGDGCPDGSILDVNFASIPITETIPILVESAPITKVTTAVDQDGDGILDTVDLCPFVANLNPVNNTDGCPLPISESILSADQIQLIEDNPQTMIHVEESISDDPVQNQEPTITSELNFCDPTIADCDFLFIQSTTRQILERTGIMLPFQPTLLNIILILAGIVVAIFVIRFLVRRRR